jgi:DNA polymerase-3 subunit beta
MSGVFFEIYEGSFRLVATDAHKLVRYSRTDVGGDMASFIVPKKTAELAS